MASNAKSLFGTSDRTLRYSETDLKKTKRRSGTSGELGVMYEKKLLMLVLHRALKGRYDFTLDTNIEEAGAFDDVVFTYKEKDGIEQRIYLQAKHKEDKNKKINFDDLLKSGNGDYALYKYFIDYMETVRNFDHEGKIKSKYFIIYTNIGFHHQDEHTGSKRKDDRELRIEKGNSIDDYFTFRKLDLSDNRPLDIFCTIDSKNAKKYPALYQFSDGTTNNEEEKTRVINVLKTKFKTIDEGKKDPKLKTISENELDSKLKEYLNRLIFAVDQSDERKLSNQIKKELKQTHVGFLSQDHVNFIFEYALNEIGQWKARSKAKPLTERNDFFSEGKEKFKKFPALYPTLVYENELSKLNFRFKKEKCTELSSFILSKEKLWLISSKSSWLSSLLIYQALNQETLRQDRDINYANRDHHVFITWKDLLGGYEFILPAFKVMEQSLLIIAYESNATVNPKTPEIVNEIVNIVCASERKVIVIAPENSELSKQFKQKDISIYKTQLKIEFDDLSMESREICLTVKKIRFEGKDEQFSIRQLLGVEDKTQFELGMSELETILKNRTDQLMFALQKNARDIFAFVGEINEVKSYLPSDPQKKLIPFENRLPLLNAHFILLKPGDEEEQFKQLCYQVDESESSAVLHLLRKWGKHWVWTRAYSRDFYMERYFYPVVVNAKKIKEEFLEKFSFDFIVFSGTDEEELLDFLNINTNKEKDNFRKKTAVFLEEAKAQKKFELFERHLNLEDKSIHWLKVKEIEGQKQLFWCRSQGDVSRLRQLLMKDGTVRTSLTEASLANFTERVIVLADEPGMGKTTTLTQMVKLMKKERPQSWVMKIDLNRHQTALVSKDVKTMKDLVDLLSLIDENLANPLMRRVLMYQLTCPGRVILLWDGFDEVRAERQHSVLTLFEFLKRETAATIWVTTRRHDQEKLENHLSVLAYSFVPLCRLKQINYLSRFWARTLNLTGQNHDIVDLEIYAKNVIETFDHSIRTYKNIFISTPLRARMVAEFFQEEVETYLREKKSSSEFLCTDKQLSIADVYEKFTAIKYDIYLRGKAGIGVGLDEESRRVLTKSYSAAYGILAVQRLFDPFFIKDKHIEYSLLTLSRIGFIQEKEDPVNFIHRTFEEYFAGEWLAEHSTNTEVKKFIGVQLFQKESGVICHFLDYFLTRNLQLHRVVLESDVLALQESLRINTDIGVTDGLGRTALHLAAQEGKGEIIEYLYNPEDENVARNKLVKIALHYAARFGCNSVVKKLLEINIDIDEDYHIFRAPAFFIVGFFIVFLVIRIVQDLST